jgi:hypothetical protein
MSILLSRYRLQRISMLIVVFLVATSLFQNTWASSTPGSGLGSAIRDLTNDLLSKAFDSASDNVNNSNQLGITLSNMTDNLSSTQNTWASSTPGSGLGIAIRDLTNDLLSKAFDSASDNVNNSNQLGIALSNMTDNLSSTQALSSLNVLNSTNNFDTGAISKQITVSNGACNVVAVAGAGNSTLSSDGDCNDQLTGGFGADRFICGDGTDIILNFNGTQGDAIVDPQNCEKIM